MLVVLFQLVQEKYERGGWNFHHQQQLEFEECAAASVPTITLHFDEESSLRDKWKVVPLSPPKVRSFPSEVCVIWSHSSVHTCFYQITKDKLDDLDEKSCPPSCRLGITWMGKSKRHFPLMSLRVDLEGAKRPYHYFTILLPETGSVLLQRVVLYGNS